MRVRNKSYVIHNPQKPKGFLMTLMWNKTAADPYIWEATMTNAIKCFFIYWINDKLIEIATEYLNNYSLLDKTEYSSDLDVSKSKYK